MSFSELSSQPIVSVRHVSKSYVLYRKPWHRLLSGVFSRFAKYSGIQRLTRVTAPVKTATVLNDISFDVSKGETIAFVGVNGTGKSTLLQIICGVIAPSSGQVLVRGRIAALLELGSGFSPQFTGRENVLLNAEILGLSKQQALERFDRIAQFADIGDAIDQEVSTYSSGMFVRLAFAVIANVDADLLVIDEALAVGDVFFQQKCLRFLRQFKSNGGTIIFVSHDTASVTSLCDRALLLLKAESASYQIGPVDEIVKAYLSSRYDGSQEDKRSSTSLNPSDESLSGNQVRELIKVDQPNSSYRFSSFRQTAEAFGTRLGSITDVVLQSSERISINACAGGDTVRLIVMLTAHEPIANPAVGFMIKDRHGQFVFAESTDKSFRLSNLKVGVAEKFEALFYFKMPNLVVGHYTINVAFADGIGDENQQLHWIHDAIAFECTSSRLVHGICGMQEIDFDLRFTL